MKPGMIRWLFITYTSINVRHNPLCHIQNPRSMRTKRITHWHLQLASLVGQGHARESRLALLSSAQGTEVLRGLWDSLVEQLEGHTTSYNSTWSRKKMHSASVTRSFSADS